MYGSYAQHYRKGNYTELFFCLEAMKRGLSISKPIEGHYPYDFICDNHKSLFKIQVKAAFNHPHGKLVNITHIRWKEGRWQHRKGFEYDILAVLVDDKFYLFPVSAISHLKSGIMLGKKYKEYYNNWSIIL